MLLKMVMEFACRISLGTLFQVVGPNEKNERAPKALYLKDGFMRMVLSDDDLSFLFGTYLLIEFDR